MRIVATVALVSLTLFTSGAAASGGPESELLVSPAWLHDNLSDPNLVVLHAGPAEGYAEAHIPGARYVALSGLRAEADLDLELPDEAALKSKLEALGISDDSRIVVYHADSWVPTATRVLFTLQAAGLGDRSSILDGGMAAWSRAGFETTNVPPEVIEGYVHGIAMSPVTVDAAYILANLESEHVAIVDARAPVFYDGRSSNTAANGHIPNAANIPFTALFNDDETLKSEAELLDIFEDAGIAPGDRVITYCHIGQQATTIVLAARRIGVDVMLYDGSTEDWIARGLPLEKPNDGG